MSDGLRPSSRRRVLDMARDVAPSATRFSADPGAGVAQPPSTRRAVLQKETV
jgi:hypothetical protein